MKKIYSLIVAALLSLLLCISLTSCSGELVQSELLSVKGTVMSGEVGYEIYEFDFSKHIALQNFATSIVSYDEYGVNIIASKIAPLQVGENNFYLHVTDSLGSVTTYAVTIKRSVIEYRLNDDKTYYSIAGICRDYDGDGFTLLSLYNGLPVRAIDSAAFANNSSIHNIHLPDSVTMIGYAAFRGCENLNSITMGSNTSIVGDRAFENCTNLTEVNISSSVKRLGDYTFKNCTRLASVNIPTGVSHIGVGAFEGCTNLSKVRLPSSVTNLSNDIFKNCVNLKSITLPTTLSSIGENAFFNCSSLTKITIPESVEKIEAGAFMGCRNLTIYCRSEFKPSGWSSYWNYDNLPVVWGYLK